MSRRRHLPKYVSEYRDRHGKSRYRFRKTGFPTHNFKSPFGTEGFRIELRQCLDSLSPQKTMKRVSIKPRSIEDLVVKFLQSGDFTGAASSQTLSKNRAIINRFRTRYGSLPAEKVTFEALDKIINKAKEKKPDGTGGMFAAQKLRKELRRLWYILPIQHHRYVE